MSANRHLSAGMEHILRKIVAERDPSADCTINALTRGKGESWMVGSQRVRTSDVMGLLQLALLRRAEYSDGFAEYYWAGPEVEQMLADPDYQPEIVKHLRATHTQWSEVEKQLWLSRIPSSSDPPG